MQKSTLPQKVKVNKHKISPSKAVLKSFWVLLKRRKWPVKNKSNQTGIWYLKESYMCLKISALLVPFWDTKSAILGPFLKSQNQHFFMQIHDTFHFRFQ